MGIFKPADRNITRLHLYALALLYKRNVLEGKPMTEIQLRTLLGIDRRSFDAVVLQLLKMGVAEVKYDIGGKIVDGLELTEQSIMDAYHTYEIYFGR